jgi:hypothetical protein
METYIKGSGNVKLGKIQDIRKPGAFECQQIHNDWNS